MNLLSSRVLIIKAVYHDNYSVNITKYASVWNFTVVAVRAGILPLWQEENDILSPANLSSIVWK